MPFVRSAGPRGEVSAFTAARKPYAIPRAAKYSSRTGLCVAPAALGQDSNRRVCRGEGRNIARTVGLISLKTQHALDRSRLRDDVPVDGADAAFEIVDLYSRRTFW
jgi:hypothetical protein